MSCRLRSYDISPPGGYCYVEPGFPKMCVPVIEDIARSLSAYRKGNGKPRSSVQECLQDVDYFQCARLGCNPAYCVSTSPKAGGAPSVALNQSSAIVAPCRGCGVPVT